MSSGIEIVSSDILNPVGKGNKGIINICNTWGRWGKGILNRISDKWPAPELMYRSWYERERKNKRKSKKPFVLGKIQVINVENEPDVCIINMIAQKGTKYLKINDSISIEPLRYDALNECFAQASDFCQKNRFSIHISMESIEMSSGDYIIIEHLLKRHFSDNGIKVYLYENSEEE